ncbi:MAG TPA: HAD family hydrolase [Mycobacteriales bacterium]|nr:HAD family hydrolase [Mycobacteriales bacterium]
MKCIFLDFFGTIVDYVPGGASGVDRSAALLRTFGGDVSAAEFSAGMNATFARFEKRSDQDYSEFSMTEACRSFLTEVFGRQVSAEQVRRLVTTYLEEWNVGVRYPAGLAGTIRSLASRYRLAVVTNTHHPSLVPDHLRAMGIADLIDAVVTSVEVGWRKPHPAIYAEALRRVGADPGEVAFVGDTFEADYLGPRETGMTAFLIDPAGRHPVSEPHRLRALADLEGRLNLLSRS